MFVLRGGGTWRKPVGNFVEQLVGVVLLSPS